MNTTTTKKVILAKLAKGRLVLFCLHPGSDHTYLGSYQPGLKEKLFALEQSTEPEFTVPDDNNQFDKVKYEAYKAQKDIYKTKLAKYKQQEKAFGDLITFIQETIAAHNVVFIQKKNPHSWNILQALKRQLAPSDKAWNLEIEQRYHKLCKEPDSQSIKSWLDNWVTMYTDGIEHRIAETTGTYPVWDFLMTVRLKDFSFADAHLVLIQFHKTTYDLHSLIEDFRQHMRLQQTNQLSKNNTYSAFATGLNLKDAFFRGHSTSTKPPCICRDVYWYSDCHYFVPKKRLTG